MPSRKAEKYPSCDTGGWKECITVFSKTLGCSEEVERMEALSLEFETLLACFTSGLRIEFTLPVLQKHSGP